MEKLLAAAVLAAAVLAGGSAQGAVPTGNLVVNGDAEAGQGSTDGSAVPVPGWTTSGGFTVVRYGSPGVPAPRPDGGANLFASGSQPDRGGQGPKAIQTIDVSAVAAEIDANRVDARVSAFEHAQGGGSAMIVVLYLDGAGRALSRDVHGRFGNGGPDTRTQRFAVPPLTRAIKLTMLADSGLPGSGEATIDNVSLTLSRRRVARPRRGKTVVVRPVKGRVVLFRRGNRKVAAKPTVLRVGQPVVVPLGSVVDTSNGAAAITSATDRFGANTSRGRFSKGKFAVDQTGSDTAISLGGRGARVCHTPRRLVSDAPRDFMVLAGPSGSRAARSSAAWVAVDKCTTATMFKRAGQLDVVDLGSRRATARRAHRLFSTRGRFNTLGRHSSATVRGKLAAR